MSADMFTRQMAPFQKLVGKIQSPFRLLGWDNNFTQRAMNAAGTDQVDLVGTNASNQLLVGGSFQSPLGTPRMIRLQTNSKIATVNPFYVTPNITTPVEVTRIDLIFSVAAGSTSTAFITKDVAGQAPGAGTSCMTGTFNTNATANTLQTATLAGTRGYPSLVLNAGEQLTLKISAVASLAGVAIILWTKPHVSATPASISLHANADIATMTIDLNIIPGATVSSVTMRWGTAATNAGTVTADITKDASTNAPGAGSSILAAAQSVKGAANTAVFPALSATAGRLTLANGDRLALKMAGTLTALADLVISIGFSASLVDQLVITLPTWDAVFTDRTLFIADRYYRVMDFWGTWSVVTGANGRASLTKDTGTTAPGGGTALLTDNSNAGLDLTATANTPVEGTLTVVPASTLLAPGDRLGLHFAGTVGSFAGFQPSVLLRAA